MNIIRKIRARNDYSISLSPTGDNPSKSSAAFTRRRHSAEVASSRQSMIPSFNDTESFVPSRGLEFDQDPDSVADSALRHSIPATDHFTSLPAAFFESPTPPETGDENPQLLDELLSEMLDDMGVELDARKTVIMLPLKNRWNMIVQHYNSRELREISQNREQHKPSFFINSLPPNQNRTSLRTLASLRVALSTHSKQWIADFIKLGGLSGLVEVFHALHSQAATIRRNHEKFISIEHELMRCIKGIMTVRLGVQAAIRLPATIQNVCLSLDSESIATRKIAAEILTALCYLSFPDGHRLVMHGLAAFDTARNSSRPFVTWISSFSKVIHGRGMMGSIVGSSSKTRGMTDEELNEYALSNLILINGIICIPRDFEHRLHLRSALLACDLVDVFAALQKFASEYCTWQIELFEKDMAADMTEFRERCELIAEDFTDPMELFRSLLASCEGHQDALHWLTSLLQHLACIRGSGKEWGPEVKARYLQFIDTVVAEIVLDAKGIDPDFTSRHQVDVKALIEIFEGQNKLTKTLDANRSLELRVETLLTEKSRLSLDNAEGSASKRAQVSTQMSDMENLVVASQQSVVTLCRQLRETQARYRESIEDHHNDLRGIVIDSKNDLLDESAAVACNIGTSSGTINDKNSNTKVALDESRIILEKKLESQHVNFTKKVQELDSHNTQLLLQVSSLSKQLAEAIKSTSLPPLQPLPHVASPECPTLIKEQNDLKIENPLSLVTSAIELPPPPPPLPGGIARGPPPPFAGGPPPPPPLAGGPPPPPGLRGAAVVALPTRKGPFVPKSALKQIQWTKIPEAQAKKTLWAEGIKKLERGENPDQPIYDAIGSELLHDIESKFSARVSVLVIKNMAESKSLEISVIDTKKAYNINIMLGRFKYSFAELRKAIVELNYEIITRNVITQFLKFVPSASEIGLLSQYKDDPSELAKSDQFLVEMMQIPRYEQRLKAMEYMSRFEERLREALGEVKTVQKACTTLNSSESFKFVLHLVLALGNFMNSGFRGNAHGFKLNSINKLVDTKSSDSKRTLLHFIAEMMEDKFAANLVFMEDLKVAAIAGRVAVDDVANEINSLTSGLRDTVNEYENFYSASSSELEDGAIPEFDANDVFVDALRNFIAKASKELDDLLILHEAMKLGYVELATKYGEDPNRVKVEEFFSVLRTFLSSFEKVRNDMKRIREEVCRRESSMRVGGRKSYMTSTIGQNPGDAIRAALGGRQNAGEGHSEDGSAVDSLLDKLKRGRGPSSSRGIGSAKGETTSTRAIRDEAESMLKSL